MNNYVKPILVTQVTNVTQCVFMDGFWFLEADGTLFSYDYLSYREEDILGTENIKFIGSDGAATL